MYRRPERSVKKVREGSAPFWAFTGVYVTVTLTASGIDAPGRHLV